jgi:hypothetical protein
MFSKNIAAILAKHHTTALCLGPEDCMKIDDLPLPLRLRNALYKAGFSTDADVVAWMNGPDADVPLRGVGETGLRQLKDWAAEVPAGASPSAQARNGVGPTVIRRPARPAVATLDEERAEDYRRDDVMPTQSAVPGRWSQLAGDVSMRGGLEALREWMHVDEHAAINKRQFEAALEKEVTRSFTMTGTGSFGDPDAEIRQRSAEFRAAGGSVTTEQGRGLLMLRLESDIQDRLRAMIPVIKGLAHVKELGVEVSAETVGRMALIRGLDALEKAHSVKNGAPKPEKEADPTPDEPISAAEPRNGVHPTPDGWARCGPNDKIPVPEAVLHDYYTQNGWDRYWGKAGDSVIYFYWTPEMGKQGLDAFPGSDKNGRRIAVQDTPWGPGHIVPANWLNS